MSASKFNEHTTARIMLSPLSTSEIESFNFYLLLRVSQNSAIPYIDEILRSFNRKCSKMSCYYDNGIPFLLMTTSQSL